MNPEAERDELLIREQAARAEAEAALIVLEEARQALRASDERYRLLADFTPGILWTGHADGWIDYASQFWLDYTGFTLAQTLGWGWIHALHDDDVERVVRIWKQSLATGDPVEVEYRLRSADGHYRWFLARGRSLRDVNGVVLKWFGTLNDVEEQKRLEVRHAEALRARDATLAALQASEGQYRILAELMPQCIWTAGPDGQTDYVNQYWCTYSGLSLDASLGNGWSIALHRDDAGRCYQDWSTAVQTGTTFECEYRMRRSDGEYRWFLGRALPAVSSDGTIMRWIGTATDIEEQKRLQRALRQAQAEADRANQAKSEFLSRMSHELRTPLNAILGFAQLLEMDTLSDTHRHYVEQILEGGQHLLTLINEVLHLSRIESGRLVLSLEPVGLGTVCHEVLDLIHPLATRRGVTLEVPSDAPDGPFVVADRQRLKQVLMNLVSNAVKYSHQGGRVTLRVEHPAPQRVRLIVQDRGPGIAAENLTRLFSPFERLGADSTGVEGTGLGLMVSRRLTEAMGGSLGVESVVGEGSIFYLDLAETSDLPAPAAGPHPSPVGDPDRIRRTWTVLAIDDNRDNLALLEGVFAHRPSTVLLTARDGASGLALARERAPDLILLDLHLPDVMGDDVLKTLKSEERFRTTPIVICSADATLHRIETLLAAGASEYLTKPMRVPAFLALLDRYLSP